MQIQLVKFGTTLVFRERGREAFKAYENRIHINDEDNIVVDFSGVITFSPSWGDEFLTPLHNKFGKKLILKNTENSSVKASLNILSKTHSIEFQIEN
ncbi:MAG: DUF4325 domain-containing protein [Candidatus Pacebacteria bacterium]|nr:DUF4325 domain-containing protein [Candidatus Paceibacterota bacterium]